jgi:hypothetical protein
MRDLIHRLLQLPDQPKGMPLRVLLVGAEGVGDVVLVVDYEPDAVVGFDFLALEDFEFQGPDFLEDLK